MMLQKQELVERLAKKGYTKKDSKTILDDVFNVVMEGLVEGNSVQVHGFGTFEVREYNAKEIAAVRTGETIMVPAYKAPRFIPGKLLKRAVKEGYLRE